MVRQNLIGELNSDGYRVQAGRLLWANRLGVLPLAFAVGAWIGLLIEEPVVKTQSMRIGICRVAAGWVFARLAGRKSNRSSKTG